MRQQSRRNKRIALTLGALLTLTAATVVEMLYLGYQAPSFGLRVLFFLMINVNAMAVFGLAYFVARSLYRLRLERQRGVVGHKIKTRIVVIFVSIISIPLILVYFVSTELVTNYIDRFFAPQFRKPVESSVEVARTLYNLERLRTLEMAQLAREGQRIPADYKTRVITEMPPETSASLQAAFNGKEESEVISSEAGDMVRAAVPIYTGKEISSVLVVETMIPQEILKDIDLIKRAYEDYLHLEAWKRPLKLNYMMILAFFTLMIIFAAIWVSLHIANSLTEPIKRIALATTAVAEGDYTVRVEHDSKDEIGMLTESFNNMVADIQEGKASLEQAYLHLENIVDNINSGVLSISRTGMLESINGAACGIFGIRPEDVLNRPSRFLLEHVESDELRSLVRGINVKDFKELDREISATMPGTGRRVNLRVFITGLKDSKGEHRGLLVVFDDISDIVKAQRAIAWQEIARRMAHEIKNPLTPIKLSTERMLKKWSEGSEDFPKIFERSTHTIIREVESLKRLVDEFSKIGKMPEIRKRPTDLHALLLEIFSLYRDYRGIEVDYKRQSDQLPAIEMDPEQIKRVLINIFENAAQAMQLKGRLTIRMAYDPARERVAISFADTGPGISKEDMEKLFVPYFSTKKDGTGLGLAIADRIMAEHGGTIRVEQNKPKGAVFTIELPIR